MDNVSKAHHFFHTICIVVSLFLIGRAIYFYAIDEDTTSVIFRTFNELEGSSYPSISFCFKYPVFKEYWKTNDGGLKNETPWTRMINYRKFLHGDFFNDELAQVDYDMATRSLEKFLNYVSFYFKSHHFVFWKPRHDSMELIVADKDGRVKRWIDALEKEKIYPLPHDKLFKMPPPKVYISKRSANEKCYSFDITSLSDEILERMDISIDPDIFKTKHGHNLDKNIDKTKLEDYFTVSFHLPHQRRKNVFRNVETQSIYNQSLCYHRVYSVSNIEILKRRNKPSSICIDGPYDEMVLQRVIQSIGCKPAFIKSMNGTKLCKSKEEILSFEKVLYKTKHPPPCKCIKSVYETQTTTQTPIGRKISSKPNLSHCNGAKKAINRFSITIRILDDIYKETVYSKLYTIETMVGNTGGYIGKWAKNPL